MIIPFYFKNYISFYCYCQVFFLKGSDILSYYINPVQPIHRLVPFNNNRQQNKQQDRQKSNQGFDDNAFEVILTNKIEELEKESN